jgi:hypothetical protein
LVADFEKPRVFERSVELAVAPVSNRARCPLFNLQLLAYQRYNDAGLVKVEGEVSLDMKFRRTRNQKERQDIRADYADTVERLIDSRKWQEMPGPQDQLPDDWMPSAFFDFWLGGQGRP